MGPQELQRVVRCLSCGRTERGPFFCGGCGGICEPGSDLDYFSYFDLMPTLTLDLQELERRYYALSTQLHPDRHATRGLRERQASEVHMAGLNQAYRTLKDPRTRAHYVIDREGLKSTAQDAIPTALAEEYFGLQELAGDDTDRLKPMLDRLHRKRRELEAELDPLCHAWRPGLRSVLEKIAANLKTQNYLQSMIRDIRMKTKESA